MTQPTLLLRRAGAGLLAALLVTGLAGPPPAAQAAPLTAPPTFTVTSNGDAPASAPLSNGVCETATGNGICTLRAAIEKANNTPGGHVTIRLPALAGGARYALTIDQLTVSAPMTITGGGAASTLIDASEITPTQRVLTIDLGASASLSGVTVQGGRADYGGGIYVAQYSTLTLSASAVTHNHANVSGGGVYAYASTLTVTDSLISDNSAALAGGGLDNVSSWLTVRRVTLRHNTATQGGGLTNLSTRLAQINDSTFSGNSAAGGLGAGGGLYNAGEALQVTNSTFSGNSADVSGGGLFNDYTGGGCCTTLLFNVSLVGNQANQAVGSGTGGGLFNLTNSTLQLQNTLVDGNSRSTNSQDALDDCAGPISSLDYNLFSTTGGCTITGGGHDLTNVPGQTGPLQDNGGPTWTHALLPGSPAIDAGNPGGCLDALAAPLPTDQRGRPRRANGAGITRCDVGAYEVQRALALPLLFR